MFNLDGNLRFVNVDMDYLKHLHNACSEVFYQKAYTAGDLPASKTDESMRRSVPLAG